MMFLRAGRLRGDLQWRISRFSFWNGRFLTRFWRLRRPRRRENFGGFGLLREPAPHSGYWESLLYTAAIVGASPTPCLSTGPPQRANSTLPAVSGVSLCRCLVVKRGARIGDLLFTISIIILSYMLFFCRAREHTHTCDVRTPHARAPRYACAIYEQEGRATHTEDTQRNQSATDTRPNRIA